MMVIADEEQLLTTAATAIAVTVVPFAHTQRGGGVTVLVLPVHRERLVIREGNGDVDSSEQRFTLVAISMVTISMATISMDIGIRCGRNHETHPQWIQVIDT
jgi:hypothetical protein